MTDILALRAAMRASKTRLDDANAQLAIFQQNLRDGAGFPPQLKLRLQQKVRDQLVVVNKAKIDFDANAAAYQMAVAADPLHAADPGLPLVLLPVRIETAFFPTAAGMDLAIRVYPDDIHVDTHEPELTEEELLAGSAYWRAVWGAGTNRGRLDNAWHAILGQLKPSRAAWSVRALLPAVARPADETPLDQPQPDPPLPEVPTRPGSFNRPARTTLLPDRWCFIGLHTDGSEFFYTEGSPIPDTLDLSFGPPKMGEMGAPDSDLPFHEGSRWLINLDAAIAAGMAVRVPLTGPDFKVGQLFVLGASASVPPAESAARLESALIAHQYTNGLAFLPPGTPTNNTARTRSAWQSAPPLPAPSDLDDARAGFQPGSRQNAALAAGALGVDGTEVLSVAPHALDDQQSDIAVIQQFLWPALAGKTLLWFYTRWDIPPGGTPMNGTWKPHIDFPFVQALESHAAGWVRSRGTLPVMRVGNQPYGFLPALSLDNWVTPAGDPLAQLVSVLKTLRTYWLVSVGPSPSVPDGPDVNADSTFVNIMNRLPVSADIRVRAEADPVQQIVTSLALAPIPGLPTNSEMFLAAPAASTIPLPVDVVHDASADHATLLRFQELFHDGVAVLEQQPGHNKDTFLAKYKDLIGTNTFPDAPPPDLFISLIQDAYTDPLIQDNVNSLNSLPGFIICVALFFDPANPDTLKIVAQTLPAAKKWLEHFDVLCAVNPADYEAAIRETLDVFSHRLDAWITSLAARRLDSMRAAQPSGLVIGAYGWVENVSPRKNIPDQHYIHAPSMGHAATAAVLRAGYESHNNTGTLAVNLVSNRVRNAEWLAAGVRNGQPVGALLGYRFERGLHEAQLDRLIFTLRTNHPLPLPSAPDADVNGKAAQVAIAARNVVDGLDLSKNRAKVLPELAGLALTPDETKTVNRLLDDLGDVLDSFGDLLLAESVHHLVAGNPLRAGLTADVAGRGEPVPDRFDVTLTPRNGRSLVWQLGALLPADFRSAANGWRTDRPRAAAEPHAEAWAATMLGDARSWVISCVLTTADGDTPGTITLEGMQLCALDVVAESSGDPSQLELRIADVVFGNAPEGARVSVLRTPPFAQLLSLTARLRAVLGEATPLAPQHIQGAAASTVAGIDLNDLNARAAALGASLAGAVQALEAAGDDAGLTRAAMIALADHGVPAAWPATGNEALSAQAASLLASVQNLVKATRPPLPDANAAGAQITSWLAGTTEYVRGILGSGIPFIPAYVLPGAFSAPAPVGADHATVIAWLRRVSRVRANAAALHDVLLNAEAMQSSSPGLFVAQSPTAEGAKWIALPFEDGAIPKVRLGLVFSSPAPIDPNAPFCGFVCDSWTEQLSGADEITGMAFKVDTPDAAAPQAVLLAVAPDPQKGWSLDILFDTVKETLELAKLRPVDLGDLVRFGRILPAIHSSSNVDQMLSDAAKIKPAGGVK